VMTDRQDTVTLPMSFMRFEPLVAGGPGVRRIRTGPRA
jgi:hypothetical protein